MTLQEGLVFSRTEGPFQPPVIQSQAPPSHWTSPWPEVVSFRLNPIVCGPPPHFSVLGLLCPLATHVPDPQIQPGLQKPARAFPGARGFALPRLYAPSCLSLESPSELEGAWGAPEAGPFQDASRDCSARVGRAQRSETEPAPTLPRFEGACKVSSPCLKKKKQQNLNPFEDPLALLQDSSVGQHLT